MAFMEIIVGIASVGLAASALICIRYGRPGGAVLLHFLVAMVSTLFPLQIAVVITSWWLWRLCTVEPLDAMGLVGFALSLLGVIGLLAFLLHQFCLRQVLDTVWKSAEIQAEKPPRVPFIRLLRPLSFYHRDVERLRDIAYGPAGVRNLLDIYRPRRALNHSKRLPVLLQIHGSGWMVTNKNLHALPLMHLMANAGWIVVSINYRLSPAAKFPDHLVDVKLAIAWLREHIADYGGDPEFVCITGGSAGGHLAALAALTPQRRDLQPGFENVDTSVAAAVPIYGRYDFLDRDGANPHHAQFIRLVTRYIMPGSPEQVPEIWELASPVSQITDRAPPFFILHGSYDSIIPVGIARAFVERLRAVSKATVIYAELPWLQHAFDLVQSPATELVIHAVRRFLDLQHRAHLARQQTSP